jgi:pimeloyl-ACP methyl ester carboxylesterase
MSISMGGAISLMLAEKYPNLYSGVADFSGVKDLAASYAHKTAIADLATSLDKRSDLISYFEGYPASIAIDDLEFLTNSTWSGNLLIPAYWDDTEVSNYIDGAGETAEEMEIECGGTPDEKPKAYDRRSPIGNPEISVPVIIVHGTADTQVPYSQSVAYRDAVNAITGPDLCRLYPVFHAGHTSMSVYGQMIPRFFELFEWSNILNPQ